MIPDQLSSKLNCDKVIAYTTTQALRVIESCEKTYKCVVLQLVTIDVKTEKLDKVINNVENLLTAVKHKFQHVSVIVSAAPPVQDTELNCNIQIANALCMRLVSHFEDVAFLSNDSFQQRGLLNQNLFLRDGIHLNQIGTKLLANNLKQSIFSQLGHNNPPGSRYTKEVHQRNRYTSRGHYHHLSNRKYD